MRAIIERVTRSKSPGRRRRRTADDLLAKIRALDLNHSTPFVDIRKLELIPSLDEMQSYQQRQMRPLQHYTTRNLMEYDGVTKDDFHDERDHKSHTHHNDEAADGAFSQLPNFNPTARMDLPALATESYDKKEAHSQRFSALKKTHNEGEESSSQSSLNHKPWQNYIPLCNPEIEIIIPPEKVKQIEEQDRSPERMGGKRRKQGQRNISVTSFAPSIDKPDNYKKTGEEKVARKRFYEPENSVDMDDSKTTELNWLSTVSVGLSIDSNTSASNSLPSMTMNTLSTSEIGEELSETKSRGRSRTLTNGQPHSCSKKNRSSSKLAFICKSKAIDEEYEHSLASHHDPELKFSLQVQAKLLPIHQPFKQLCNEEPLPSTLTPQHVRKFVFPALITKTEDPKSSKYAESNEARTKDLQLNCQQKQQIFQNQQFQQFKMSREMKQQEELQNLEVHTAPVYELIETPYSDELTPPQKPVVSDAFVDNVVPFSMTRSQAKPSTIIMNRRIANISDLSAPFAQGSYVTPTAAGEIPETNIRKRSLGDDSIAELRRTLYLVEKDLQKACSTKVGQQISRKEVFDKLKKLASHLRNVASQIKTDENFDSAIELVDTAAKRVQFKETEDDILKSSRSQFKETEDYILESDRSDEWFDRHCKLGGCLETIGIDNTNDNAISYPDIQDDSRFSDEFSQTSSFSDDLETDLLSFSRWIQKVEDSNEKADDDSTKDEILAWSFLNFSAFIPQTSNDVQLQRDKRKGQFREKRKELLANTRRARRVRSLSPPQSGKVFTSNDYLSVDLRKAHSYSPRPQPRRSRRFGKNVQGGGRIKRDFFTS